MTQLITVVLAFLMVAKNTNLPIPATLPAIHGSVEQIMGSARISLENRHAVKSVSDVMKRNILLNLAYLSGSVKTKADVNWEKILDDTEYQFVLKPGQVFAYHDSVLPEYKGKISQTTNAHFHSREGFISDGYLVGDGVCHFASLFDWAAQNAGLEVVRTKAHSIAKINEVPDEYGVSIYVDPTSGRGERNNLYITNNQHQDITFRVEYKAYGELKVTVLSGAKTTSSLI